MNAMQIASGTGGTQTEMLDPQLPGSSMCDQQAMPRQQFPQELQLLELIMQSPDPVVSISPTIPHGQLHEFEEQLVSHLQRKNAMRNAQPQADVQGEGKGQQRWGNQRQKRVNATMRDQPQNMYQQAQAVPYHLQSQPMGHQQMQSFLQSASWGSNVGSVPYYATPMEDHAHAPRDAMNEGRGRSAKYSAPTKRHIPPHNGPRDFAPELRLPGQHNKVAPPTVHSELVIIPVMPPSAGTGEAPMKMKQKKQSSHMQRGNARAQQKAEFQNGRAMTMKEQLEALQNEDPACVFIARRINRLGFASAEILRSHFSTYGKVETVLVAHSRVKSMASNRGRQEQQRLRAAGVAFIVMSSAEVVAMLLAECAQSIVNGVAVQLQPFRKAMKEDAYAQDGFAQEDAEDDSYFAAGAQERWHSPGSDTSNRSFNGACYAQHQPSPMRMQSEMPCLSSGTSMETGQVFRGNM